MIVLAFDPGTSETGWALLNISGGGRLAVRTYYVNAGNVASKHGPVRQIIADNEPDLVAIESMEHNFSGHGGVTGLIASSAVAGGIAWLCAELDVRYREITATRWRSMLLGKANADNALIKTAILRLVDGWPASSNAHQRDAAGCGVAAGWSAANEKGSAA